MNFEDSYGEYLESSKAYGEKSWEEFEIEKKLKKKIFLIEEKAEITPQEIKRMFPNDKIAICDFYLKGAENGLITENNILYEEILNFDHHAPIQQMKKYISSTNFAIDYVRKNGILSKDYKIIINHTDCDSVLSSLILMGLLPPNKSFGEAAIAADHTGEENQIADLLQAIQEKRDFEFSFRNLKLLLRGNPIDSEAQKLLEKRKKDREKIKSLIEKNKFQYIPLKGGKNIAWIILDEKIDGALAPSLLPNSLIIILASLMPEGFSKKWEIKVRLGLNAKKGLNLNQLNLPDFGGRWNAGSTKRYGGTDIEPTEFVKIIKERIEGLP